MNKKRGFTLIELMVVIAIIGLLSSTVFATLNSAREKAKVAKAKAELKILYKALLKYNIDNNSWPPNCNNMDALNEWNGTWKNGYT